MQTYLQENSIAAHVVSSSHDFCTDEQVLHLNHLVHLRDHGLEVTVEAARYTLSRCKAKTNKLGPKVGQDNTKILEDILSYSAEEIARLEASGVVN